MEKKQTPKRFRSKRNKGNDFKSFNHTENSAMAKQPLTKAKALKRALNSDVRSFTSELLDRVEAFRKLQNEAEKTNDISAFYVDLLMDLYPKLDDEQGPPNPEAIYTIQFIELELKVLHKRITPSVFDEFNNAVSNTNEVKSETQNKSEMENNTMSNETKATVEVNAPVAASNERLFGGNVTSAISGGVSGALTSLAIDFIFGTDQTTADMAIDAGVSGAIGAASGYAASRLCGMDDSSYLVTGSVGAAAGLVAGGSYRAIKAQFGGSADVPASIENLTE